MKIHVHTALNKYMYEYIIIVDNGNLDRLITVGRATI